ncbi:MAG: GLUG motif-containing protein, partial [Acetatifactor sp.]
MNSRRAFLICLGSLLVLQQPLAVMAAAEGTSFEEYRAGSLEKQTGAKETIYTEIHISTEEELAALAENCRLDSWSEDKRVILDADIALSRQKNIVIPSFGGIFEGNGHKIEGINITETGSAIGLFRYLQKGGVIRKLTVTGMVNPSGSRSQVGGIVGVNYGNIENCSVGGLVTGDNEVGGIAGVNADGGTIRSCKSYATVIGNHSTGGIAGNNYGVLNNCSNSGAINIYNTEVSYNLDDIT